MAPAKRKADAMADATAPPAKRGRRPSETGNKKTNVSKTATSSRPRRLSISAANTPRSLRSSNSAPTTPSATPSKVTKTSMNGSITKSTTKTVSTKGRKRGMQSGKAPVPKKETIAAQNGRQQANISIEVPTTPKSEANVEPEVEEDTDGPSHWLMKAEPESRIEKGRDVKFSIDDLKAATSPEGWDGVRNYSARNNMRLMMEGDQAFFYHSTCKVPGIVGTMEVVKEHSVDGRPEMGENIHLVQALNYFLESAFDPEHPYYDEKSDRAKPKWCLVHVEFRQKFPEIIKLKDLQKYAKPGGVLEKMQVLNQTRLSVSKVTKKEWDFIMSLVDSEDVAATAAQHQP